MFDCSGRTDHVRPELFFGHWVWGMGHWALGIVKNAWILNLRCQSQIQNLKFLPPSP